MIVRGIRDFGFVVLGPCDTQPRPLTLRKANCKLLLKNLAKYGSFDPCGFFKAKWPLILYDVPLEYLNHF